MIVVDSSALVAIALKESDGEDLLRFMIDAETVVGAPTVLETRIVLANRKVRDPARATALILDMSRTRVKAFDEAMTELATAAFLEFGKGRHPAKLNFGDCMAYAVAKSLDAPLLYKGNDFAQTDIRSALG